MDYTSTPPASSLSASVYSGSPCPVSISFGNMHGSSPAAGSAVYDETDPVALTGFKIENSGTLGIIGFQAGGASFQGWVSQYRREISDTDGPQIRFTLIDWRDFLHNNFFYAALNIQEQDGRVWHILPGAKWLTQQKVWVTKEMGQMDFTAAQSLPATANILNNLSSGTVFSCATVLNMIGKEANFTWTADSKAMAILKRVRPLNLDWNNGTKQSEAIDTVMAKAGLQWTITAPGKIYITKRGWSTDAMALAYLSNTDFSSPSNFINAFCQTDAESGSLGIASNDKGKRVEIIGDRNSYQWKFLCRIDWNRNWSDAISAGGAVALSALISENGCTLASKLKEMPKQYQDDSVWPEYSDYAMAGAVPAVVTRNEMTIDQYIRDIVWKVYRVDPDYVTTDAKISNNGPHTGTYKQLDPRTLAVKAGGANGNVNQFTVEKATTSTFPYPAAKALVTDSNVRFIAYTTYTPKTKYTTTAFSTGFKRTFVPRTSDVTLTEEEQVQSTGNIGYVYRLHFSNPPYRMNIIPSSDGDTIEIRPDIILCSLAISREMYTYIAGAAPTVFRARTRKKVIQNLKKAYLDGAEVSILSRNFVGEFGKVGGVPIGNVMKADDISKEIATMALAHATLDATGSLQFQDVSGRQPDGVVDSVNFEMSTTGSWVVRETVNFAKDELERETSEIIDTIRVSEKQAERDIDLTTGMRTLEYKILKYMGATGKAIIDYATSEAAAEVLESLFGSRGSSNDNVDVEVDKNSVGNSPMEKGSVVIVGQKK